MHIYFFFFKRVLTPRNRLAKKMVRGSGRQLNHRDVPLAKKPPQTIRGDEGHGDDSDARASVTPHHLPEANGQGQPSGGQKGTQNPII